MSDVDPGGDVAVQDQDLTASDRLARAVAEVQPVGAVVYPETDVMRAVLSGGAPAGNTDELPAGVDEMRSAMQDVLAENLALAEAEGEGEVAPGVLELGQRAPSTTSG
jgi:hypothetical protein